MSRKAFNYLDSVSNFCKKCKGSCWHEKDNKATQREALQRFGLVPNLCINDDNGKIRCPFHNLKS